MELTAEDIAGDLDVVDKGNTPTVAVSQVDADGGAAMSTVTGVGVLKRSDETREVAMADGTAAQVTTTRWHLASRDLPWVPKKRDRITDGTDTWVIDSVTRGAFGTRYVCESTQLPS